MSKKMIKFISYDLKNGLLHKVSVYLFTIVASVIATTQVFVLIRDRGAAIDYIFDIFAGMSRFYIAPDTQFNIPFLWFVFMIIPSFLIGDYAISDLNAYGIHMIVKSRSKVLWWISKTIWCFVSVVVYFVMIFFTIGIYAYITERPLVNGTETWGEYVGVYSEIEMGTLVMHGVMGPFLTILSLCMLQMVLSLVVGSLVSYVTIISYIILSAYITSPVFIGNYAMLFRNRAYMSDGLDFNIGVCIEVFVIILSFVAGLFILKMTPLFKYSNNNL